VIIEFLMLLRLVKSITNLQEFST